MKGNRQTIELDCPPGGIRPWDLIGNVIKDTGLESQLPAKRPSAWFGHVEWDFVMDEAEWESQIQPIIKPRIEALYHAGVIRYGSW